MLTYAVPLAHKCSMDKLQKYLARQKLTHEQAAPLLGVSRSYLTKLANGTAYPSRRVVMQIARATGNKVPASAWFQDTGE